MCVICLCVDRFGLGWAHDAFSFACHMFMHFPCIHTSFQYSWYLKLLGTFLIVFLSLPLCLFMLDVSMAPKCKSTPARNPLRFGASSSSDPSPSTVRFCDDDDGDDDDASDDDGDASSIDEMSTWHSTLCHSWQKGGVVLDMKVVTLRGRVSF